MRALKHASGRGHTSLQEATHGNGAGEGGMGGPVRWQDQRGAGTAALGGTWRGVPLGPFARFGRCIPQRQSARGIARSGQSELSVSKAPHSKREIAPASRSGSMDAEPEPVPSFLPFQLPQSHADAFIDELYFESENAEGRLPQESVMSELNESRTELFSRVQTLKKDLKDWRGVLNTQVKSYREEIGDLRDSLNSEVERLKTEFSKLRSTINNQVEKTTSKLAELNVPEETLSAPKPDDSVPVKVSSSNVSTE